jgi:acetyl-CoA synthetase
MTRGIWGDLERYLDTYWRRFSGVWVHGDWASVNEEGFWFLHGRSDDTISLAGKRLGLAEVESVLADHPAVAGPPPSASRTRSRARRCGASSCRPPPRSRGTRSRQSSRIWRPIISARRSARAGWCSSTSCRGRARRRSCGAIRAAVAGEDAGHLSSLENPRALEAIRAAVRSVD